MAFWQNPFVSVLKTFKITPDSGAPNASKSTKRGEIFGDVREETDHDIRCTIWRLSGTISANNYIQFPPKKSSNSNLNLVGRYIYMAFKPVPLKYFVMHFDYITTDNLTIRISFSNLYKSAKITSTMCQFPFVVPPSKNTVEDVAGCHGLTGKSPRSTSWTMFIIDNKALLRRHTNREFGSLKSIQICSNLLLKGVYTSNTEYDPQITLKQARTEGIKSVSENLAPMPREMNFLSKKGKSWDTTYQLIRFPSNTIDGNVPFDSVQKSTLTQKEMRILNPRPIPNTKTEIKRPASAPVKTKKKVFTEIPEVAQVTLESSIVKSVEILNDEEMMDVDIESDKTTILQTKIIKKRDVIPLIELGLGTVLDQLY